MAGKPRAEALQPRERDYRESFGNGLYLLVRAGGSKRWEYRYKVPGGKTIRPVPLGGFPELGEREARRRCDAARAEVRESRATPRASKLTVARAADTWIEADSTHWSPAHHAQVVQCFRDHVNPQIGNRALADVTPGDVLDVVGALLADGKVETARRVRQRLDALCEWAMLHHGLLSNPAAATKRALTKKRKAALRHHPKRHFPAVALDELPTLLRALRAYPGSLVTTSFCWFVAMTACRTGEARFASWDEFNLDNATWSIPRERMKAGRPHGVPLAPEVVALLRQLYPITHKRAYVFPHPSKGDKPVSENLILYVLGSVGFDGKMSGHGWRTLFSTWSNEHRYRSDVIERCLAHAEGDATRDAYNRSTLWRERVELMNAWAQYLVTSSHAPA